VPSSRLPEGTGAWPKRTGRRPLERIRGTPLGRLERPAWYPKLVARDGGIGAYANHPLRSRGASFGRSLCGSVNLMNDVTTSMDRN